MGKIIEEIQKQVSKGEGLSMIYLDGVNGFAWFCGGRVGFAEDGAGWLAGQNIQWDKDGNLLVRGMVESNNSGNQIVIDPNTRTIRMIDKFGSILVEMGFYDYGDNNTGAEIVYKSYDANRKVNSSMRILGGTVTMYHGDVDQAYNYASINHFEGKARLHLDPEQIPKRNEAYIGDIYLDGENLKVRLS